MKTKLVGLVLGIAGFVLSWTVWHVYQDHLAVHAIIQALQRPAMSPGK